MAQESPSETPNLDAANRNWRRFVLFRVFFNARFYYPVLAVMFLDLGLSATQYTMLNFVWALAIVGVDLPAGVLADRIGRRPLVIGASICMVIEMILLCIAPRYGGMTLFICCFFNRLLSGTAEGMANGADEALVFDSLAERGRETEWPLVLDQVLRWQSFGFVIAMLVGGAVYDPGFLNHLLGTHLTQGTTLRFPIILNLLTAIGTLIVAIGMQEPSLRKPQAEAEKTVEATSILAHLGQAGIWILQTPLALFAIVAGVSLDSLVRLFLTFSSTYFRLIELPAVTYGVIGAVLGGLGIAVLPITRRLVGQSSAARNFALLALVVLFAFIGIALRLPYWGVLFAIPLSLAMSAVTYLVSYYLNAIVDSRLRATVLSFKGLVFNLGYGFVSLAFAGALQALRTGNPETTIGRTLEWFPVWLAMTLIIIAIWFWPRRKFLLYVGKTAEKP